MRVRTCGKHKSRSLLRTTKLENGAQSDLCRYSPQTSTKNANMCTKSNLTVRSRERDSPAHHTHRLAVAILLNTHAKHTHKNDFSLCAHTFHELWRITKLRNYARMRFLRKATTYNTQGMHGIYVHCPVIGLFFNLTYLIGIALSSAYIASLYLWIWWIFVWKTSAKSYICRAMCKFLCDPRTGGWETLQLLQIKINKYLFNIMQYVFVIW